MCVLIHLCPIKKLCKKLPRTLRNNQFIVLGKIRRLYHVCCKCLKRCSHFGHIFQGQRINLNVNVNVSFLTHSGFSKANFPTYTLLLQRNMKVSFLTLSSLVVKCMVAAYWPKAWRFDPGRVNQNKPCQYSRVSCWSTIIHMNRHVCQLWLTYTTIGMQAVLCVRETQWPLNCHTRPYLGFLT